MPAKKPAKKAATAPKATRKATKKHAPAKPGKHKPKPKAAEQPAAAPTPNTSEAFMDLFNDMAGKAGECASAIGQQVIEVGKEIGKQAEAEIEKGKKFLRDHPTEAVVGALAAATIAGLAAARATYKAVRKR